MPGMREALEAAFDEHEAVSTPEEDHERGSSQESRDVVETERAIPADAGGDDDNEVLEVKPLAAKPRDATGKFVPSGTEKQPDANKVSPDGKQKAAAEVAPPTVRPPVSWRPEVREKFASIPKEVQDEVHRREREIETTLRETAGARQYAQAMHNEIAPYQAMIQAEGGNPVTAVRALLQTAYHLRTANPQTKATMVAHMIQQHGVDVNLLDQALSQVVQGKSAQMQSDPMFQHIQQELAPIKQFVSSLQSRQQQITQGSAQSAQQEYETFMADPKNEFAADVASDMADFLDVATKNGRVMPLSEAYQRAIMANPQISKIIADRQVSARTAQRSAAVRRARDASASLPSSGGAPAGAAEVAKPKDLRSAISAAWDQVANSDS